MTNAENPEGVEGKSVENNALHNIVEEKVTKVGRPSKLTKEQIEEVSKLKREGMRASQIAALTGIPHSLVYSQMYKEKKKEINKVLYLKYKSEGKILSKLKETNPEEYERRLKYAREYQRDRKLGIKKSDIKDEPKPIILPAPIAVQ